MKTVQEFGGFVLDAVRTFLKVNKNERVRELLNSLSRFDVSQVILHQSGSPFGNSEVSDHDSGDLSDTLVFFNQLSNVALNT